MTLENNNPPAEPTYLLWATDNSGYLMKDRTSTTQDAELAERFSGSEHQQLKELRSPQGAAYLSVSTDQLFTNGRVESDWELRILKDTFVCWKYEGSETMNFDRKHVPIGGCFELPEGGQKMAEVKGWAWRLFNTETTSGTRYKIVDSPADAKMQAEVFVSKNNTGGRSPSLYAGIKHHLVIQNLLAKPAMKPDASSPTL